MNPFEMVVLIVAIVAITSIFRARHGSRRHDTEDLPPDPESARMREEIRALKERVAVLERIATDRSSALEHEIEALRSRD